MKESYTFYALDLRRYFLMALCVFFSLTMILRGVISGEMFALLFTKKYSEFSSFSTIVSIGCILLFAFLFFIANKLAFLYADEKWIISFDRKEIEIRSNRRIKRIYLISQLREFAFSRSNKSRWTNKTVKTIKMSFKFKKKGMFPQYMICANEFVFSSSIRKSSYKIFNQFLDNFYKHILQTQFQQKIKDKSFHFYSKRL